MIERLPDLELFTRIVEAGSLSAAARSLGLQQPAVSKRLAAMERELEVRLVRRDTHRLKLTEEGQAWYEACRRWVGELHEVSRAIKGRRAEMAGTIRVNAPVAFGRLVVLPMVLDFLAAHPQVTVDLTLDDRRADLVLDRVDVAVRVGPVNNPEVVARHLLGYTTRLVASPAYLDAHGRPRTVADLLTHQVLSYGRPDTEDVTGPGGTVCLRGNSRLITNDSASFMAAVEAGQGIGLSSPWLCEAGLERGVLEAVLPTARGQRLDVHAVFLPARVPARVRVLVEFLRKELPGRVARYPGISAVALKAPVMPGHSPKE